MQEIIREIFLDDVALVAEADDELRDAEGRVELHDVPEDGLRADLHHGLRARVRFLGDARALAAGENHALHAERFINSPYRAICCSENAAMFSPAE